MLADGITLYNHQETFLSLLEDREPLAGFMEAGTGKTLPGLCFIHDLLESGEITDALIVAPAATQGVWPRDMEKFKPDARERLERAVRVVSYDLVWRRAEFDKEWGIIVLDESHYIKSRTAKRTKALLQLATRSQYRIILTGTPIGNKRLEDIWTQFTFLFPAHEYGHRAYSAVLEGWTAFCNRYCVLNKYYQPYRYVNVSELQSIIADHSYQVTKAECLDLPAILPDEVYSIEIAEKAVYKEMHKHSTVEEMELIAVNPLAKMLRLRQLCSGFMTDESGEIKEFKNNKIKELDAFLEGYEKKLVIFCEYTRSINEVSKLVKKRKLKYVVLDGRTKDKNVWRKFQEDESIRVIICQSQAAGAGIDLYAADTELFYEMPLSSTTHEQCRARIHRVGQTQKCSYVYFVTKGTIETAIYRTLKGYADFNERLFKEYLADYQKGIK